MCLLPLLKLDQDVAILYCELGAHCAPVLSSHNHDLKNVLGATMIGNNQVLILFGGRVVLSSVFQGKET